MISLTITLAFFVGWCSYVIILEVWNMVEENRMAKIRERQRALTNQQFIEMTSHFDFEL